MASSNKGAANAGAGIRTLGPVPDLERHLPADWWKDIFNPFYLKTDGDVVENVENTVNDVNAVVQITGIKPGDHILDLCCGQGRHSLELARRGYEHVTGVDRSRYLIRLAKNRARQQGLNLTFREGDARKFQIPKELWNCVLILGNSFGYFDREEDDLLVLKRVFEALRDGGVLLMDISNGDYLRENFEKSVWDWIDKEHFVCRERSLSSDGRKIISREIITHAEKGIVVDQFYAERLYNESQITEILERAGFRAIRFHEPLQTESTRNKDLGMMASRLLLTCTVEKAPVSVEVATSGHLFAETTVLLGDPSLFDPVKLYKNFSEEDFDTINRMKDALAELKDCRFHYLDSHESLISMLLTRPPRFVLNFCDEGFRNEPTWELHMPAILEMLGIPYSGAGPASMVMCYNKSLVRMMAQSLGVPVPLETYLDPDDQSANLPSEFPALVKPNFGDGSMGIRKGSVVHTSDQLLAYVNEIKEEFPGDPILIQEFLSGNEYTVGIVGNPGLTFEVLPVLAVDYSQLPAGLPRILGYESKWEPDSPYWNGVKYVEAEIDEETRRRLTDYAMLLFERLGCRDYGRFDFRCDRNGVIKLLEVNPNPAWCWDGKMNLMAGFAGMSYSQLLRKILEAAEERIRANPEGPGVAP